ncbi:MAG TPA: T9SS type B sorting domain-containing protein [Bacteroidetes bacterium]|nr:T9SS type B sorting domain-containing protein [Bacteroidota bacterium]
MKYITSVILLSICLTTLYGQQPAQTCATDQLRQSLLSTNPNYQKNETQQEKQYQKAIRSNQKSNTLYTLPVVVHIIHDNGPENISDQQVLQGIANLNDAFRNIGYYNPQTGADVELEFCLAQRDPEGNATNGIVRYQSPLTDMSTHFSHAAIANLATWNTKDYINIRLVKEACLGADCSNIAGYASLPPVHGLPGDGIVMEAVYFGSSQRNGVVINHEMGHYLGLLHTFAGGCQNGDCLTDGDRVCDTPPDNLTGFFPCGVDYNSCSTDADDPSTNNPYRSPALGGLGDQNDMYQNYMDYSGYDCYDRFTEGQKQRMHFFLENVRSSLLVSKACLPPCPDDPVAFFSTGQSMIETGGTVSVNNLSENASDFRWYINGALVSEATDTTFGFDTEGSYTIRLEAISPLEECGQDAHETTITVSCPVAAGYAYSINGDWLVFADQSTNAPDLQWTIKDGTGATLFTSDRPTDSLDVSSLEYIQICLLAANGFCDDQQCQYLNLTSGGFEICNNQLDDDGDGLVDLFDPDCPCDNEAYQAYCPVDCEYVPDSFPAFEMKLKWTSEVFSNWRATSQNIVTGDINGDGNIEVITQKSIGDWTISNVQNNTIIFKGTDGSIAFDANFSPITSDYINPLVSIADINADGKGEIFALQYDTIFCHSHEGILLWKSEKLKDQRGLSVNIADFNGDGIPELSVGNEILNAQNGKVLASGNDGGGCNLYNAWIPCVFKHTIAADLLPTPGLELAAGNTVYQVEINNTEGSAGNIMTPVTAPLPVLDGFTSVGDINGDGELDVVVVRDQEHPDGGGVWVWDPRTLTVIAAGSAGENGGVAFIGDVTGDCLPEIGMTFEYELRMYQYDGTPQLKLLYSLPTTDESGFTGITMFDFNQDGKNELVYRDETDLRILEGATGVTLASYPMKSGTGMEYPIVADVDNDGEAEILIHGYQSEDEVDLRVYCFESAGAPWAPARSVWNQYGYHVTNVNDDLTIPRYPQNQATPLEGYENCLRATCPAPYNSFLAQATYRTQEGCVQFPATDLALEILGYECTPDSLFFDLAISNLSETALVAECIYLSSYPAPGQPPMETICWPATADTLVGDTLRLAIENPSGIGQVYFTINDAGSGANEENFPVTGIIECNYANNTDAVQLDLAALSLDLGPDIIKCESEVLTLNAGAGFATYLWNDNTIDSVYSSSYAGLHYVEATDGCGRVYRDTVEVTFDHADDIDIGADIRACPGEVINFNISGNYDFIKWLPAANVSCDSCADISVTFPQGQADTSFTLIILAGKENCYSADTVDILIKEKIISQENREICEGENIEYMGSLLTEAGQYEFDLNGCDSFVVLDLQINKKDTFEISENICPGDSIFFGGTWIKEEGVFLNIETNILGCDSLVFLNISMSGVIAATDTIFICEGDSVEVFGQWILGDTLLSNIYTSAAGCDSTQNIAVQIMPLPHLSVNYNICAGDSISVGNGWLSGAGSYHVRVNSLTGCDTIYEVELMEIPPIVQMDTIYICEGDSVNVFGGWIKEAAILDNVFSSAAGCDSVQFYEIIIEPLPHIGLEYTICESDSILVGGEWLSGAGFYNVRGSSLTGCDTMFEVEITTIPPVSNIDTLTVCEGDSVNVFGGWVSEDALLGSTFTGETGCDSTQFFQILIAPQIRVQASYNICESDSILVGGEWLSGAGFYTVQVSPLTGCDTIYEVEIIERPTVINTDTVLLCAGDSAFIFNGYISAAGTYSAAFNSIDNCDSTQIYIVEILPLQQQADTLKLCEGDSLFLSNKWIYAAGLYVDTIDALPCKKVLSTQVEMEYTARSNETIELCPGDSIYINNAWVKGNAEVDEIYSAINGCDSVHTIIVTGLEMPDAPVAETDCENMETILSIGAGQRWTILWDNGDTTLTTVYKNTDTANVTLFTTPACEIDFSISLPKIPDLSDLPENENQILRKGNTLQINLNLDPAEWQVHWSPAGIFSCDTCFNTIISPVENTIIEVTYIHISGCIYSNTFQINIEKESGIYIPNVFSPNGDGINDFWNVLPPQGVAVFDEVSIFNRWGGHVANWKDIPEVAWDGRFKGRLLDPAVFVYFIKYTDRNGRAKEKKGDVTIIK